MPTYLMNKNAQSNGDHEVHDEASTKGCLPLTANRYSLGWFSNCDDAVAAAKRRDSEADGCAKCIPACHRS